MMQVFKITSASNKKQHQFTAVPEVRADRVNKICQNLFGRKKFRSWIKTSCSRFCKKAPQLFSKKHIWPRWWNEHLKAQLNFYCQNMITFCSARCTQLWYSEFLTKAENHFQNGLQLAGFRLPCFFSFVFFYSHTIYNHGAFPWLHGKNEHSVKFESQQPSIGQRSSRNSTATSKAVLPTIPSIKGKFYKDNRDNFLERLKKCYVPCFSTYLMPTRYVIK